MTRQFETTQYTIRIWCALLRTNPFGVTNVFLTFTNQSPIRFTHPCFFSHRAPFPCPLRASPLGHPFVSLIVFSYNCKIRFPSMLPYVTHPRFLSRLFCVVCALYFECVCLFLFLLCSLFLIKRIYCVVLLLLFFLCLIFVF